MNGAGKSSVAGAAIRERWGTYYNPDEAARRLMAGLGLTQPEANSVAWNKGVQLLRRTIDERLDFALESTLGGSTITQILLESAAKEAEVHVLYVGLETPDLHIARVQQRVNRGGHFIPEQDIRRRYESSRSNLIALIPQLASLRVFDNSFEADPADGKRPKPTLLLHMESGKIIGAPKLADTPDWAKPIVLAAMKFTEA